MEQVRLGRTELLVSNISLGTWSHGGPNENEGRSVGWSGFEYGVARDSLIAAAEHRITHWDTADVYGTGRSETLIGEVLKEVSRNDLCLATKVGWDPGPHDHFYHGSRVREQLESSLRRLGTDRVEIYYMHHCNFGPNDERLDEVMELFHRFKDEGKIRHIGLSDWNADKIMGVIERVDPDVVQPYRNVAADTLESSGLRGWIEEKDVGLAFFSPLRHGLLLGKYDEPVEFGEGDFRVSVEAFTKEDVLGRVRGLAEKVSDRLASHPHPVLHGLVGALLEDSKTGCALVGMRNRAQVEAAALIGSGLSAEDAAWVRDLYQDFGPI